MLSLSQAKDYLYYTMKRPIWHGKKGVVDPLYTPLCKSEDSFKSSLHQHFERWVKENEQTKTKDDKGNILYPKAFLDHFAAHRNRPNIPDGYGFLKNFDYNGRINHKIPQPTKSLAAKLGPIAVDVFGSLHRSNPSFPVAFLNKFQDFIKNYPSLKGDHLIARALLEYMRFLDKKEIPDTAITEACMEVFSLALQKKNLEDFRESGLFEQLIEQPTQ